MKKTASVIGSSAPPETLTETEIERREELYRLRQTEKPTLPSIIVLSLIAVFYVSHNPGIYPFRQTLFMVLFTLNASVLVFQVFIVPSRYYGQFLANAEAVVLSAFAAAIIVMTGGFSSPFFFSLYLIMLSTPINKIVTPLVMATLQEIFLGVAIMVSPSMMADLFADPVRGLMLIFSPVGIAYFTAAMLYETLTQKTEKEKAKKLSQLFSAEKKKLEAIVGGIGELVVATNESGRIELVNGAVFEILGKRPTSIIGLPFQEVFKTVDYEARPSMEVQIPQKKGEPLTFKVKTYSLFDSAGVSNGKIFVFRDITSEKEFERMKIDFVSMAAHELRTPLTSLKGYLSFLKEEIYAALSAEQKVYLDRSAISADSLSSLVDNLLNISRIESGNLELSLRDTDLVELFHPVVEQLKGRALQKSVTVQFAFDKGISMVPVDGFRISEVLTNLLDNAISYTPSGGSITVSVRGQGREVVTSVADTGQGIPESSLKHLFTKFYRVSGTLAEGSKGTGLGLFICKSIIEMHHGRIWVESELGKGSKFFFALPVQPVGLPVQETSLPS